MINFKYLNFRKATADDIDDIWQILQQAIERRKKDGSKQWQNGYPNLDIVKNDIEKGIGYVLTGDNKTLVYSAIILNDEPDYKYINGKWLSNGDFYVLHRIAVSKEAEGKGCVINFFKKVEEFSLKNNIFSVKVDTNFDNLAMLHILEKQKYVYCGEVHIRGEARKAFEKILTFRD
jgi:hypothetical protein